MPDAARISDMHTCPLTDPIPHMGGPVLAGSPDVVIEDLPAARATDPTECAAQSPDLIAQGSGTVFINDLPASRITDKTQHGGVIVMGAPTVDIGEVGDAVTVLPIQRPGVAGMADSADGSEAKDGSADGTSGGKSDSSKPSMTDEDKRKYQDLTDRSDELAAQQREVLEKLNRGEISEAEGLPEIDRLERERKAIDAQARDMRAGFNPDEFDSDGYLREPPIAPEPRPSHADALPTASPEVPDPPLAPPQPAPGSEEAARRAAEFRSLAKHWAGLANFAELLGPDKLAKYYAAKADMARLRAARLEGGEKAVAREAEIIAVRRAVQKAIDKGLDWIPPGPTKKVKDWVKSGLKDGFGQLSEPVVKWLQRHGYM